MKHLRLFPERWRVIASFADTRILDETAIQEVGQELMDAAEKAKSVGTLIVDCRRVRIMSSAMIGKLVLLNKKTKTDNTKLRFWNIRPKVFEIFRITKLDKVFEITDESEDRVEDPLRFVPELFEQRGRVLAALESADFYWWRDYSTVYPLHDLYGIEVNGIRSREDARQILKLLHAVIPEWKRSKLCVGWRWGADPNFIARIHRDRGRPWELF
jgi:anti-anti-sigma factor